MRYLSTLALLVATSIALVAAAPQNDRANNGQAGLDAALLAQEAVELAQAGDAGVATTGAVFASIDAQFQASSAAISAQFAAATEAASNGKDNKAKADDGKKGKKDN